MTAAATHQPPTADGLADRLAEAAPLVQQDSTKAAVELESIVAAATTVGDVAIEAEAAYLWARAEVNNGHLDKALTLIDRARRLWLASGDDLSAWRTDLGRMHVLDDLGRHSKALEVGTALIAVVEDADLEPGDAEQGAWLRAAALENVGVGHGYMGDHERALDAYIQAEAAYRALGWDEDVPRPMANRGVELLELGRPAEAVAVLGDAAAMFVANDDALFSAKCLAYKARGHVLLGDHLAAAAATTRAEQFLAGLTASTEYARTQLVRAETLRWLNLFDEAIDLYASITAQFADAGLLHDLADAHYGCGLALAALGSSEEATRQLTTAEDLFSQVGADPMRAACLVARAQLAGPDEAQALCTEALVSLETSGRSPDLVAAWLRLAETADTPAEAERHLDAAADALVDQPFPDLEWRVAFERGRRHRLAGELAAARDRYHEAAAVIDRMRGTLEGEHHRLLFMSTRDAVTDELVALELDAHNLQAALALTERARARTLVERLSGELAGVASAGSPELNDIYDTLLSAPVRASSGLLDRARLMERATLAPRVMTSNATVPRTDGVSLAEAVVTYHRLGDELVAFCELGDEATVVRNLASVGEVQSLVQHLDAQWRRFDDPGLAARQHGHLLAATVDILQQLYVRLIAPIPHMESATSAVFVPCAPLGNVPFGALHDGTGHLVERMTHTYSPSREVAAVAAHRSKVSHRRRLALGVPDENTPNVAGEIEAIGRLAPDSTVVVGDDATLDRLEHHAPDADVIHLACHGFDRPDSPLFSALKLADGWLSAAGVAKLKLDGQLVILSACSSGRQFRHGGELVGLPRAFLAAGAGGVIVNLWRVGDSSASALMTEVHSKLDSLPPAEALRHAQLAVMWKQPHPYHWGPAVLYGAASPKEPS